MRYGIIIRMEMEAQELDHDLIDEYLRIALKGLPKHVRYSFEDFSTYEIKPLPNRNRLKPNIIPLDQ